MTKNALAALLVISGIVLSYLSFYAPPQGEIADSVLNYFCQCLIWAGSVLGITSYIDKKIK